VRALERMVGSCGSRPLSGQHTSMRGDYHHPQHRPLSLRYHLRLLWPTPSFVTISPVQHSCLQNSGTSSDVRIFLLLPHPLKRLHRLHRLPAWPHSRRLQGATIAVMPALSSPFSQNLPHSLKPLHHLPVWPLSRRLRVRSDDTAVPAIGAVLCILYSNVFMSQWCIL
jgi:hypothetical protein